MIQEHLLQRGIKDPAILAAFKDIPRELFVPEEERDFAYSDHPLNIGYGQTISQPFIVAYMLEMLDIKKEQKVLEIGMGSGYVSALLAYLSARVYAVERIPLLACRAMHTLHTLRMPVNVKIGDGTQGWEEERPYDRILVSAASPQINEKLYEQLAVGGILLLPVGGILGQELVIVRKKNNAERVIEHLSGCTFVPLIGKYGFLEKEKGNKSQE